MAASQTETLPPNLESEVKVYQSRKSKIHHGNFVLSNKSRTTFSWQPSWKCWRTRVRWRQEPLALEKSIKWVAVKASMLMLKLVAKNKRLQEYCPYLTNILRGHLRKTQQLHNTYSRKGKRGNGLITNICYSCLLAYIKICWKKRFVLKVYQRPKEGAWHNPRKHVMVIFIKVGPDEHRALQ